MPYTKSELETVSFYQDFVTELRDNYFDEIKTFLNNKFRRDGILYSFEDIFTGLGLEDTSTEDNSDYSFLLKKDYSMYTFKEMADAKNDPEIQLEPEVTDHREDQYSKSKGRYPLYEKSDVLNKVIDREISELTTPEPVGGTLPEGIKNGDRVAVENIFQYGISQNPLDIWFIEDNKKRKYQSKFAFFSSVYSKSSVKLFEQSIIDSIVDGKDITLGKTKWDTDNASEGVY